MGYVQVFSFVTRLAGFDVTSSYIWFSFLLEMNRLVSKLTLDLRNFLRFRESIGVINIGEFLA